jgi:glycosyltransferase involved in cell wall biosynthesis
MARVTEVKNPTQLVELARTLPEVRFVMAGGGNLMNEVTKNVPENLTILGWTDASLFWSAVDVCLSTSINEGMPISLIEAQMSGVPVVATDVGSTSEVVVNEVTGFITQRETCSIADAILFLKSNKQVLSQMESAASEHATKMFNLKRMVNSHLSLYENAKLK